MKKRAFWLGSLVFVSAAICLHFVALNNAGRGALSYARAADVNATEDQRQALKTEAHQYSKAADSFRFAGIGVAILSVVSLIQSYRKNERAIRPITIVMLGLYLLLQLAVV
jgi:hypothetical protein